MKSSGLSLFTQVEVGEAVSALLLASYDLLKTAPKPLILTQGGAEVKSYSSAVMAILLFWVVPDIQNL
jgi:hypothetical protein